MYYTYIGIYLAIGYMLSLALWAWLTSWNTKLGMADFGTCVFLGIGWALFIPLLVIALPFIILYNHNEGRRQ
jgi:hypothetical protein